MTPYTLKPVFVEKTAEGKALQRALLQYYEPRNAEKVIKALKMTHREDLIPLLVPAEGRRAVQRSARRAAACRGDHPQRRHLYCPPQQGQGRQESEPRNRSGPHRRRPPAQPRRTLCAQRHGTP